MSTSQNLVLAFEQAQSASAAETAAQGVYDRARASVTHADKARHTCYTSDSTTQAEREHRQSVYEIESGFCAQALETLEEAQRVNAEKQEALATALNSASEPRGCNPGCGGGCSC